MPTLNIPYRKTKSLPSATAGTSQNSHCLVIVLLKVSSSSKEIMVI